LTPLGGLDEASYEDPRLRKRPTDQIVLAVLDDEGGPLSTPTEIRTFLAARKKVARDLRYLQPLLNKLIKGKKRHILVDTLGLLLRGRPMGQVCGCLRLRR